VVVTDMRLAWSSGKLVTPLSTIGVGGGAAAGAIPDLSFDCEVGRPVDLRILSLISSVSKASLNIS